MLRKMKHYIVLKPGKADSASDAPMDVRQMEQVLKRVSYAAAAFGLSAASCMLLLRYGLLLWICGSNGMVLVMDDVRCFILFLVGLLFLFVYLLRGAWLKDYTKPILAYPNAAAHYKQ